MKIIKTFIIILTIILIAALTVEGLFVIAVPKYLDSMFSKSDLKNVLKQKTGLVLSYENVKFRAYPNFDLCASFENLSLKDSASNRILTSKQGRACVNLPSLLFKRIVFKDITAKDMQFEFSRHKDKKLYLGNYALEINEKQVSDFETEINKLEFSNIDILFNDMLVNKKIHAQIKDTKVSYLENKEFKAVVKAEIFINDKKKSTVDINWFSKLPLLKRLDSNNFESSGIVKNFDLSDYSSYISTFSKKEIISVFGIINADFSSEKDIIFNLSLKNFAVNMKNPLDSIKADSEIKAFANIDVKDRNLFLNEIKLTGGNWAIKLNGEIKKYEDKNPGLNLTLSVPNSDIHSMYWLVPSIDGDPQDSIQKFKKHGAWGKADGVLEIKGTAEKPEIKGDINISDVYLVKNNPIVPHSKVLVRFMTDKVKVFTKVLTGFNEYVLVDGIAEMKMNGNGDFHIGSSENVDLATVEYMLLPIQDVVGFPLGPVPYMTFYKGKGNIDLYTKGNVIEGEATGHFNFKNTKVSLDGLNTVLDGANGGLIFNRKKLTFNTKTAYIKNQALKVSGKADLDGNIDFDVTSDSVDVSDLLDILKTSPILRDKKAMTEPVDKISGKARTAIKIKGKIKDFGDILKDGKVVKISGNIILKNAQAKLKLSPLTAKSLNGKIGFDDESWTIDLAGMIGSSKIGIKGGAKNSKVNVDINAQSLKTDELLDMLTKAENGRFPALPDTHSLITFNAKYNCDSNDFIAKNLKAEGALRPIDTKNKNAFAVTSGRFKLQNGDLTIDNFRAGLYNSKIIADGRISDVFSKVPSVSGRLDVSDFNVSSLNSIKKMKFISPQLKKILNAYEDYQGVANISLKCKDNKLKGFVGLKDIKFSHSYFKTPISVDSGEVILDGERLVLKSLIAQVDKTPVFLSVSAWDLDKTIRFKGYFTTKITEYFANKYINSNLAYPIKPRGDITFTSDIEGDVNSFRLRPIIKFAEDADIYYMGANLGDETSDREIKADISVVGNLYYIKKLDYVRYMTSQNDRTYPLTILTASGVIQQDKKKTYIRNLNVETLNNANAKLFNVLFKKSVLKNGMFNCKINVKGDISSPKILGQVNMENLDMPLYDTVLKNINLKFKEKEVNLKAKGLILDSDFNLTAVFDNKIQPPYTVETLEISSEKINLDSLIDSITQIPTPSSVVNIGGISKVPFTISDILIKKGSISANDMIIRGLPAKNYYTAFTLGKDLVLKSDKLEFDLTGGKILGNASYDFSDGRIKADLSAYNVDSNKTASALFGFKDQIFGKSNGTIVMTTKGASEEERIKNLSGYVYFDIADGKMPELGSVEYLLKAGSFIKGGITGASISNFIDLIAPIKTGHFDSIKGRLALKNGVAQDIEIFSKGENLNLYINGEYDILLQYANMRIFGRLTKRANNILGAVGNLSFNSLLNVIPGLKLGNDDKLKIVKEINKIPGVELTEQQYRVFTAKIDGKITDDKYVKTFRWIE